LENKDAWNVKLNLPLSSVLFENVWSSSSALSCTFYDVILRQRNEVHDTGSWNVVLVYLKKIHYFYWTWSLITVFTKKPSLDPILGHLNPYHSFKQYFCTYVLIF